MARWQNEADFLDTLISKKRVQRPAVDGLARKVLKLLGQFSTSPAARARGDDNGMNTHKSRDLPLLMQIGHMICCSVAATIAQLLCKAKKCSN